MVKWHFVSNYLQGELSSSAAEHRVNVFRYHDEWCAEVEKITDYGWALVNDKTDNSLIELLNWAEEELKFHLSHPEKV
jgi:hypothetical protein